MVILLLVCTFNFDPSKSGGATALPAPIVVMPLVSFSIYLFCCTTFPCAFSFILSSPMILLLLQCLLHPPCPSFRSPSSSSSSTSFCAWAYFESGPICGIIYSHLLSFLPSLLSLPPPPFPLIFSFLTSLFTPFVLPSSFPPPPFLPPLFPRSLLPPSPLG